MQNICPNMTEKEMGNTFSYLRVKKVESVAINTNIYVAEDTIEGFFQYLFEDGKSPKTIESYVGDIVGFIKYIQSMGAKIEGAISRF